MTTLLEWAVDKPTTEKLAATLNAISEAGREIEQITFVGGRDWTIISFRELDHPVRNDHGR